MVFRRDESANVVFRIDRDTALTRGRRAQLREDTLVEGKRVAVHVELPVGQAGEIHRHHQLRLAIAERLLCLTFILRGAKRVDAKCHIVGQLPQQ